MKRDSDQDLAAKEVKLKAWLKTKLPQAKDLEINSLQRAAASGNSNQTYLFDLRWLEGGQERIEKLVIRWPPENLPMFPDYDLVVQFRIMKHLEGSGVPVPRMYWMEEDREVLGVPFFVMERIEGEIPPGDRPPGYHAQGLLYEATSERRAEIWRGVVEVMAKVHFLDWERLGLSFLGVPKSGKDALNPRIAYWERILRWASNEPFPVIEAGLNWLRESRYVPGRLSLCWGDARLGNLIYRDGKVAGVLDWEMAHIGPPESDLAWFLASDELLTQTYGFPRLKGLPGVEETLGYYESLTGRELESFHYHQMLAWLSWTVIIVPGTKVLGMPLDYARNNWATRKLAELLGLERSQ